MLHESAAIRDPWQASGHISASRTASGCSARALSAAGEVPPVARSEIAPEERSTKSDRQGDRAVRRPTMRPRRSKNAAPHPCAGEDTHRATPASHRGPSLPAALGAHSRPFQRSESPRPRSTSLHAIKPPTYQTAPRSAVRRASRRSRPHDKHCSVAPDRGRRSQTTPSADVHDDRHGTRAPQESH